MDDIACPRCKSTKYRNPNLKMMVNLCGHALCENCIELLFVKGSAVCPEPSCGVSLRRTNYRTQVFENAEVEKEVDIRRKVLRDYNKREEDFDSLAQYNDYLEEIEVIVFNLANDVDTEETKRKIEQYKRDNKVIIQRNKGKLSRDEEQLEEIIEYEKQESDFWKQKFTQEEAEERRAKHKSKEALIDELMFSEASAGDIVASHLNTVSRAKVEAKEPVKRPQVLKFSSGIKFQSSSTFLPVPKEEAAPLYRYEEVSRENLGPQPPAFDSLGASGYLDNTRAANAQERASGFLTELFCSRALEEAFCGLYCGIDEVGLRAQRMDTT